MTTELSDTLLGEYNKILETGEFSDIEILVGKEPNTKIFRLHSFVLKVCSPYFRIALSNNWTIVENNIIKFRKSNIPVKIFEIIVKYIYGGEIEIDNNDVKTNIELLITADEFCLDELCSCLEKHLLNDKESLKLNFILILHIAKKFDQFSKLSQFYIETCQKDPLIIFKTKDFAQIEKDYLLEFFINNTNNHSLKPIIVWDKLIEWSIAQFNNNQLPSDITKWTEDSVNTFKDLIQPFIPYINFEKISRLDFFQKIKPFKNVFDDKFYIKILESCCFNDI